MHKNELMNISVGDRQGVRAGISIVNDETGGLGLMRVDGRARQNKQCYPANRE